jgi:hypothetical protein
MNREEFLSKVGKITSAGCREWQGYIHPSGYGIVGSDKIYAHRLSWQLVNGPIPEDKLILHKCDNRKCVEPTHLYCGTQKDNLNDRDERNPISAEIFGSGKAKLHKEEIRLIRELKVPIQSGKYKRYKFSAAHVAKMFKVNYMTILRVWNSESFLCKEGYYV